MPRDDGNKLALKIIRAVLDAAHPIEVDVGGVKVDVGVERRQPEPWPRIDMGGLDAAVDGPWPSTVELSCSWASGSTKLVLKARYYEKTGTCALEVRVAWQLLVWVGLALQINKATDGSVAPFYASVSLYKRRVNNLLRPGWPAALKRLVAASGMPRRSASRVEVFRAPIPTCEVLPSPEIAFQRIIHIALLKLDFIDAIHTAERGVLVDVEKLAEGGEDDSDDDEPDDEPDDDPDGPDSMPRQYWAGGHQWGDISMLEPFMRDNYWQLGWTKDDPDPTAKTAWKRFADIRVSDWFAIKGYGGTHNLVIYYLGVVRSIDQESGRIELDPLDRPLYRGDAPRGPGAGKWFDALVPVQLPQFIAQLFGVNDEGTGKTPRLEPLPATRRRKGLMAFKGYSRTVLGILQSVGGGITREDFFDAARDELPDHKDSSLNNILSTLKGGLGVLVKHDNLFKVTPAGQSWLENEDPDVLSEWLLTRVLGIDMAIAALRDRGALTAGELNAATGTANASTLAAWLADLRVVEQHEGKVRLSERGSRWAAQIHWQPEIIEPEHNIIDVVTLFGIDPTGETEQASSVETLQLPDFEAIVSAIGPRFPRTSIVQLHAGLWSRQLRHFVVLAGLSGSGKTELAHRYAAALTGDDGRVLTIPVQPGWYDPAPLLGYVNPIVAGAYVSTPFLDFAVLAGRQPSKPHVVLLDEMNLSRPEQYLAPLLSAMETGRPIDLYSKHDDLNGAKPQLFYPPNLAIIGTLNMDETTHGLSDKVLDRAFVLEFWMIDVRAWAGWDEYDLGDQKDTIRDLLDELMRALQPARLHFGWRVIEDIVSFLAHAGRYGGAFDGHIDTIVCAKILPKLRGEDSTRFRAALAESGKVLAKYPNCKAKLAELEHDLQTTGSARFWR